MLEIVIHFLTAIDQDDTYVSKLGLLWCVDVFLYPLQHTATHCNTLQHTAIYCKLQHATEHCSTLWHTATHCNITLHPRCNALHLHCTRTGCTLVCRRFPISSAIRCNILQHAATHCHTLQHAALNLTRCTLVHRHFMKVVFNTLQHTVTHYNTL